MVGKGGLRQRVTGAVHGPHHPHDTRKVEGKVGRGRLGGHTPLGCH